MLFVMQGTEFFFFFKTREYLICNHFYLPDSFLSSLLFNSLHIQQEVYKRHCSQHTQFRVLVIIEIEEDSDS